MDELQLQLDAAIDSAATACQMLVGLPSEDNAEEACFACRKAVQFFYFLRTDYGKEATQKTDLLTLALDDTESMLKEMADGLETESVVWKHLESVQCNKELVHALLTDDAVKVREIVRRSLQVA